MKTEAATYLFIGQDSPAKDKEIEKIKQEFLTKQTKSFNLDVLYAKELNLKLLQERLLFFPAQAEKRVIVIKNISGLKPDIKEFIVRYLKKPQPAVVLILDTDHYHPKDEFLSRILSSARVCRFKETESPDTFDLAEQIALRRADYSLSVLRKLLENGERPEIILGGLRYASERDITSPLALKRRLKLLLACDIEIKTGKLKPVFALEKLVVNLCLLK